MEIKLIFALVTILATIEVITSKLDVKCRDLNPGDKVYFCPQILSPVCGSNKRTYDNHCDYCAERWEKQQNGDTWEVVVEHEGRCDLPGVSETPTFPTLGDIIKNPRVPQGQNSPFPHVEPNPIYQSGPVDQSYSPFSQQIQQSQDGFNFFKNVLERFFPNRQNYGNNYGQFNKRVNTGQFVPSWKASWQNNRDQTTGRYDWQNYNSNSGFGNNGQYGSNGSPFDRFSSQLGNQQTGSQSWRRTNCQYGSGCARNGLVCGSDRRLYYNECHLCSSTQQSGREVKFLKPGRC